MQAKNYLFSLKKISTVLFLSSYAFVSCNEQTKTTEVSTSQETVTTNTTTPETKILPAKTYYASYVGSFMADSMDYKQDGSYTNLINITVSSLEDGKAAGHSIIAGNDRPFNGTYKQDGSRFIVSAKEPGDDKHDGRFEFTLDTVKQTVTGKWYCNDMKIAVPVRKYELTKKVFVYNPENNFDESAVGAGLYNGQEADEGGQEAVTKKVTKINASTKKLTNRDVENLYQGDLELIRNAIYARHGYSFRNRRMRYFFDNNVDWYIPTNVDIRSNLTALEKENIELLKRYEKHAEKYYDEFGR